MVVVRGPTCPRCGGECGFWGGGAGNPTLFCETCGWNEIDGTTAAERIRESLLKRAEGTEKLEKGIQSSTPTTKGVEE